MMKLREQYPEIGNGWHKLLTDIDFANIELKRHPLYYGILSLERSNGMLKVKFGPTDEQLQKETMSLGIKVITDALAYHIERMSAKICEDCGQYGLRRTELPVVQSLCTKCYALKYNAMKEATQE